MTYCAGVPHEGHDSEEQECPLDDPRHISRVRGRRAVEQAERDLFKEIEPPQRTVMGMLRRALTDDHETEQP
jgi:hypothetical protein